MISVERCKAKRPCPLVGCSDTAMIAMPRGNFVESLLPLLAVIAVGCTTVGSGIGYTASGASGTTFSWKSANLVSGTMKATLADGTKYSGKYYQIARDAKVDSAKLFSGWYSGWGETDWGVGASPDFVTEYTDRVVANLTSPSGSHMRCGIQLASPSNGMYGGGSGECQIPGGDAIDVRFPPS